MKVVYTPDKTTLTLNNEPYLWITKSYQIFYIWERERTLNTLDEERHIKQKSTYKKTYLLNYKNDQLNVFLSSQCKSKWRFIADGQVKYEKSEGMLVNARFVICVISWNRDLRAHVVENEH